ncbi:MAG: hypothetical protein H7844_06495 [Nitrospirae bacterium YQR-1]
MIRLTTFTKTTFVHIFIIILFPVILLTINNKWIYANSFYLFIDPWIYLGYFLDFTAHINAFKDNFYTNYFGTRFPWIIPGTVAYKIFSPLTANYVLHLTFLYTALFSFYFIVKHTLGKNTALFTTVLFGLYSYFLYSIGWDYVDGAEITYFLLTVLSMVYFKKTNGSPFWAVLCGFAYALLIYTHMYMILYTIFLLLFFLYERKLSQSNVFFTKLITYAGITFLFVTVMFCLFNYYVSGKILFFLPQLNVATDLTLNEHRWKIPFNTWFYNTGHLVFPLIVLFTNLLLLIYSFVKKKLLNNSILLQLLYVLSFIMGTVFEIFNKPVLQQEFYASNLMPLMFLSVSTWFYPFLEKLELNELFVLAICAVTILVIPFGLFSYTWFSLPIKKYFYYYLVLLAVIGSILFFFISGNKRYIPFMLLFCMSYSIINYKTAFTEVFQNSNNVKREDAHVAIVGAIRYLKEINPDCSLLFWYNLETDPMGRLFRAINASYMWRYRYLGTEFPKIKDTPQPLNSANIVFLSSKDDDYKTAINALNALNYKAKLISVKHIENGKVSFNIYFITKDTMQH